MAESTISKIASNGRLMAEGEELIGEGGSKKKLLLVITIIVLILVFAGFAGWWYFVRTTDEEDAALKGTESHTEDSMAETNQKNEGELKNPVFSESLSFTVNLRDGKRYLKVTMKAVFEDPTALGFLMMRIPLVKDAIITTLQNKTTVDLRDHNGILNLKRDLKRKLNNEFTEDFIKDSDSKDRTPVKKILFEEFLLQ